MRLLTFFFTNILKTIVPILFLFALNYGRVQAQQFTATEGSIYGGVVNTDVQPAAGVNMPFYWDVEVAGVNAFWNNNIVSSSPLKWKWRNDTLDFKGKFISGNKKRWATGAADVHLLNFLFRWPHRNDLVAGAGWNIRSAVSTSRLEYSYEDSMKSISDFLEANAFNTLQQGGVVNQQWMEWYATVSKVVLDDRQSRLTIGGTVKLLKGMAAEVADIGGVSVSQNKANGTNNLVFTYAQGRYGYSENIEELNNENTTGKNAHTFMNGSPLSPGLDLGLTYLVRKEGIIPGFSVEEPAGYDWKIEVALTDWGRLKYPLGSQSRIITGVIGQPDVEQFYTMARSVKTLNEFNDSLASIANITPWQGKFSISLPTALRINLDKFLGSNFYLNTRMVLNASFLNPGVDYRANLLSYIMVTPRWEIRRIGVYTPLYLNFHGSLMAGAAVRLGPLLVGVHDFGWLFHNTPTGGGYVALVIRGLFNKKGECPAF